jgi:hypothetical protein
VRALIHGVVVETDLDIPGAHPAADGQPTDLGIALTTQPAHQRAAGERIVDTERFWVDRLTDGSHQLAWPSLMSAHLSAEQTHADITLEASTHHEYASMMVSVIVGVRQFLQGALVLHASVVHDPTTNHTTAIVADAGYGKTALAAIATATGTGAQLVSEDVAVVNEGNHVHRGVTELRLRTTNPEIAALNAAPSRTTIDGRIALGPPSIDTTTSTLTRIVIPRLDRTITEPHITVERGPDAVAFLVTRLRFAPIIDRALHIANFLAVADLVGSPSIEVTRIAVPWRPPIEPIAADIIAAAMLGRNT